MEAVLAMHALKRPETELALAQAYVRSQPMHTTLTPEEGLCKGTIFPELSKPYGGWKPYPVCE